MSNIDKLSLKSRVILLGKAPAEIMLSEPDDTYDEKPEKQGGRNLLASKENALTQDLSTETNTVFQRLVQFGLTPHQAATQLGMTLECNEGRMVYEKK